MNSRVKPEKGWSVTKVIYRRRGPVGPQKNLGGMPVKSRHPKLGGKVGWVGERRGRVWCAGCEGREKAGEWGEEKKVAHNGTLVRAVQWGGGPGGGGG